VDQLGPPGPGTPSPEWIAVAGLFRQQAETLAVLAERLHHLEEERNENRAFRRTITVTVITIALTMIAGLVLAWLHVGA
jgi:hypothetical protein